MSPLDNYFDAIFCINLDRSPDRWEHAQAEARRHGIATMRRFPAVDWLDYQGLPENLRKGMANAMYGCTASHGRLLSHIACSTWDRVLVLEDDWEVLSEVADLQSRFSALENFVPKDWDLLYLGAHYADHPFIERINEHCFRVNEIKTTSSYAITRRHAALVAPLMVGGNAPDDVLSGMNPHCKAYCIEPRLMGQYENKSTVWSEEGLTCRSHSMRDSRHVREWLKAQQALTSQPPV